MERNRAFEERLAEANLEMRSDIESILASNRESIIIVNGDHGPYLAGNCLSLDYKGLDQITRLDLQDTYGTFLAIRWPDDKYENYDDIRVVQDVFESVFKYLYQSSKVLDKRVDTTTLPMATKFVDSDVPKGAVVDGVIMFGENKGEPLFIDYK